MSAKKKKEAVQVVQESQETTIPVDQVPQPEVPEKQIDAEGIVETQPEPTAELPAVANTPIEPKTESADVKAESTEPIKAESAEPAKPQPLTLKSLQAEIAELRQMVTEFQAIRAKVRKAVVSNGKVTVVDKVTGRTFLSKNSTYQTLLKEGALKELVEAGIFGSDPPHNQWGCYSLFRAWPDRFQFIPAAK